LLADWSTSDLARGKRGGGPGGKKKSPHRESFEKNELGGRRHIKKKKPIT